MEEKKPPLGSGERFKQLTEKIESRSGFKPRVKGQTKEEAAKAIAASIGRKKFGAARFKALAAMGKRRRVF